MLIIQLRVILGKIGDSSSFVEWYFNGERVLDEVAPESSPGEGTYSPQNFIGDDIPSFPPPSRRKGPPPLLRQPPSPPGYVDGFPHCEGILLNYTIMRLHRIPFPSAPAYSFESTVVIANLGSDPLGKWTLSFEYVNSEVISEVKGAGLPDGTVVPITGFDFFPFFLYGF